MTTRTSDELGRIGQVEELKIASTRRDSTMRPRDDLGRRVGNDLYVHFGLWAEQPLVRPREGQRCRSYPRRQPWVLT